ncbi:hypothetical protein BDQ12DRAFT_739120 [Crucibulum laeve]|uniref:Uncharacterized protein n=1 Tax=Crucibulum laeve TaxID=68775 RepID=A0A5C3LJG2_9AGAR|nr:hypothetical protein BDQ12DRAFT_739120 [Crucibulum laeve]
MTFGTWSLSEALMDPSFVFFEPPPSPTTLLIASILRLSLKYDVPFLRRRAPTHLRTTFPTSLSAWRQCESQCTIPSVDNTPFKALQVPSDWEDVGWGESEGDSTSSAEGPKDDQTTYSSSSDEDKYQPTLNKSASPGRTNAPL